jgi:hypothetical protein
LFINFYNNNILTGRPETSRSFSPTGLSIEEAGDPENIYDEPHKSAICTSPPPQTPEYYNYSAIRNQQSSQACGMVLVPLTAVRTSSKKPTPPPKPTKGYKYTGTMHRSSWYEMRAYQCSE